MGQEHRICKILYIITIISNPFNTTFWKLSALSPLHFHLVPLQFNADQFKPFVFCSCSEVSDISFLCTSRSFPQSTKLFWVRTENVTGLAISVGAVKLRRAIDSNVEIPEGGVVSSVTAVKGDPISYRKTVSTQPK